MKQNHPSLRRGCDGCALGKSKREAFADVSARLPATKPMMRLFHDNSGPVNINDLDDQSIIQQLLNALKTEKYLSLLVDEYSGYLMGKPIYSKDQSVQHIIDIITLEENQTGHRTQLINADESGEIRSTKLVEFLKQRGIKRNLTNKATPQHNAIVERANGTVWESTRANLFHAKLHQVFWGYAMLAAIYALNCVCVCALIEARQRVDSKCFVDTSRAFVACEYLDVMLWCISSRKNVSQKQVKLL